MNRFIFFLKDIHVLTVNLCILQKKLTEVIDFDRNTFQNSCYFCTLKNKRKPAERQYKQFFKTNGYVTKIQALYIAVMVPYKRVTPNR